MENPTWLDRQIAESDKATMDFEVRFAERQAAWERFCMQQPNK
jgi:hypothetical protein